MAFEASPWYSISEIFISSFKEIANSLAFTFIGSSFSRASTQISISRCDALRYTLVISGLSSLTFFFFICTLTNSPVRVTIPISCPGEASVATISPILKVSFSVFLKNSFLPFLKRTSIQSKAVSPFGKLMFESQSKTVNLLQLSVPQVPLFLHPLGVPSLAPVEQFVQAIILNIYWSFR